MECALPFSPRGEGGTLSETKKKEMKKMNWRKRKIKERIGEMGRNLTQIVVIIMF